MEYLGSVVHAGPEVVRDAECDHLCPGSRLEVVQLAGGDVAAVYDHVDVAVWSTLFVPEPHSVTDLVRYCPVLYSHTHTHTRPAACRQLAERPSIEDRGLTDPVVPRPRALDSAAAAAGLGRAMLHASTR